MFVAIFEAMFQVRLKGIIRKPSHVKDYEHNAQGVIDALGNSILNMDLSHISGSSIVKVSGGGGGRSKGRLERSDSSKPPTAATNNHPSL